jgi:hypothetical protein
MLVPKVRTQLRAKVAKPGRPAATGQPIQDRFQDRGRKKLEEHLPVLLGHIRAIVEPESKADLTLGSARIYTPLTAGEVRQRLRAQFGYKDAELPCVRTLCTNR